MTRKSQNYQQDFLAINHHAKAQRRQGNKNGKQVTRKRLFLNYSGDLNSLRLCAFA
jgi:hypothetical protein